MKDFHEKYDVFESALEIPEPWYVFHYELAKEENTLHIYIEYRSGAEFPCPNCSKSGCKVHDTLDKDRIWRHLDFWQYRTLLHARMPRVKCESCGKILTVVVDWARPGAGFTLLFDRHVLSLMVEMPVAAVARKVGEHDTRLWRVFHYYVDKAMENMDVSNITHIAMDETSRAKGHKYVTFFIDTDTKRLIFATKGKSADVLQEFCLFIDTKGVPRSQINEFCCDMSPAFISGIEENFPNASITFDKFHVMKMVNEALDQVRRQEQTTQSELKNSRYIWLKNEENLTKKQANKFAKLKDMDLATGRAYRMKISLQKMYSKSYLTSEMYFDEWYNWVIRSQLEPMVQVAKSLKKHKKGILRWFITQMTNGLLEGINSLVQAAKRKARGYRTNDNLIAMAYATVNKLDLISES
ncbi:ISL3 family transposase [Virgibacillus sp. 179-BFC.A HS]|uniref:ISL3 family transposase n=3 Tax=Tigheibacillus jepli TaxID=3035914 RepID=A0ABU5CKB3_9BACI|nr:ISL3 family transposase [Virgibacillus sp. 179-BFC.A HS]MDY0404499.1 ISL3 family transposase [Virgibacillus sp. 179-BFC.A HS]MDY0404643.1 ISL3 family transposase [Virgibacillus sp. 179-BFC.A HS]MDY0404699.1 ISL3 family transposase [Virgibacillus sp. 179-BFC.A HS]MDY0404857.1 ISL3 family transposase [Virgibacillus sp. 179-BFC.A HS]MDY0405788.1 ISL3 family transposase [Virgibacillus sp. 179-BFC.A HS]